MAVSHIRRGADLALSQRSRPGSVPVRVDSDTDTFKFGTGASGTTEKEAMDLSSVQTVTGVKTFSALPVFGVDGGIKYAEVAVSSAELLALNATPKTIVAAPGAGIVLVPLMIAVVLDFVSAAYAGIAAGEDLVLRYTDGSGAAAFTVEATGFLDAVADAIRLGAIAAAQAAAITPVANAPLVLHMSTGEVTTGDSPLRVKLWYSQFSTGL